MESPAKHWTIDLDFLICSILLDHGLEEIELGLEWVQELFTPLPVQLFGRTHSEIASRIKRLQLTLLNFLRSKKRFNGAELVKWLRLADLAEVSSSLRGRNGESSFYAHYKNTSGEGEVGASAETFSSTLRIVRKTQGLPVLLPLDVSDANGLEPPVKKTRAKYRKFSFEEDKCICMSVARSLLSEESEPCFSRRWFQMNMVDSGLLPRRTCFSIYGRFRRTLHSGVLSAIREAQLRCLSQTVSTLSIEVEKVMLEWLTLLHRSDAVEVLELIQVELDN